jgi:hypothetical protein
LKNWLSTHIRIKNPETEEVVNCTLEDKIALALLRRSLTGNVRVIRIIFDTLYGKIKESIEIPTEQPIFPDTKEKIERLRNGE